MKTDSDNAKILIVDDDADALELLAAVMQRVGYSTIRAQNGSDAIDLAEEHWNEIDTIVLDLMMPGTHDGYSVCDRLRANTRTANIPIIIVSAKSSPSDMTRSYAAGAFQHISKPYDIGYLMAVIKSMVRLRRLELAATSNAEKYWAILDNSPIDTVVVSPEFNIVEMNFVFRQNNPEANTGDNLFEICYDDGMPEEPEAHPLQKALATGQNQSGITTGIYKGKTVYREVHAAPLKDPEGNITAIVDLSLDITRRYRLEEDLRRQVERHKKVLQQQDIMNDRLMTLKRQLDQKNQKLEEAKQELERLSITDTLTNLYNRRHFDEAFEQEARRSRRYKHSLSVLMLDIDHFKSVNDTYGHPAGDKALKHIATTLLAQLRETDTVARYGGEEFAIILPETDTATAMSIGERLRKAIASTDIQLTDEASKQITISVGVACDKSNPIPPKKLLAMADEALYEAKESGRNQISLAEVSA